MNEIWTYERLSTSIVSDHEQYFIGKFWSGKCKYLSIIQWMNISFQQEIDR
jgi:hypothetical protein